MLSTAPPWPNRPALAATTQVLCRCEVAIDVNGLERSVALGWEIVSRAEEAFEYLRRGAVGISKSFPRVAHSSLRPWLLRSREFGDLVDALAAGQVYEVEVLGPYPRILLTACRVRMLPLAKTSVHCHVDSTINRRFGSAAPVRSTRTSRASNSTSHGRAQSRTATDIRWPFYPETDGRS